MAREKIQIKKIDNATARQVTFSKRRRGLMKKAEELSILCDADVALIVFSCTGKLCEFASSSMKGILERRRLHSKNLAKLEEPSLKLQLVENRDCARLNKEIAEKTRLLRQMRGEELHGLGIEDLQKLESTLESGLNCVLQKKSEKIMRDIIVLQERSAELVEENERLKQQVEGIACGRKQLTSDSEYVAATNDEDGQSSESVINACNSSSHSPDYDYDSISAISLRLGLPYRRCL